jgi:hypothetical protein
VNAGNRRVADFCREIETYLCRKNDGHLIRVTGPSFDLVASWAAKGIPLKVACRGIDRCFERYYRKGPRRRPVRIDFCEADVLDVFDQWRRAVGVAGATVDSGDASDAAASRRGPSLPSHLERVVLRLTSARASGRLGDRVDELIDRVAAELDRVRADAHGLRGEKRRAALARLLALDDELVASIAASLAAATREALVAEAEEELASFRDRMAPDAFARARESAVARLIRERFELPTIAYL